MPKIGMEPIRKADLIKATITEIGLARNLDVTVGQIARRAGMSTALAHHYFGGKEAIFLAAMRHVLSLYGAEVRAALQQANTAEERLVAILGASFSAENFRNEVISAWLNFYVLAQTVPGAKRLLIVYQRRLHSNLVDCLRPKAGARAAEIAAGVGALIDGVYLRQALAEVNPDPALSIRMVMGFVESELKGNIQ